MNKSLNQPDPDAEAEKPGLENLKFCIGSQEGQQKITSTLDSKDWRKYVTPELRDHLVNRLIQISTPNSEFVDTSGKRLDLETYCRKMESEVFEKATSRTDYYNSFFEKTHEMRKKR